MNATAETATATKRPKTEYEKVTMSDGREVEFPKNRKLSKQSFITGVDGYTGVSGVRLDFSNGETRFVEIPGGDILKAYLDSLTDSEEHKQQTVRIQHVLKAATHGYEQKLGDEMAYQPKKDEPEPTLEDKITWVDELIGRLQSLEWTVAREGGGGLAGAAVLLQALVALSGKPREEIAAFLKPMSKEERAVLKRTSPVKEKIEEIEAENAKKSGIDGTALLGKIGLGV